MAVVNVGNNIVLKLRTVDGTQVQYYGTNVCVDDRTRKVLSFSIEIDADSDQRADHIGVFQLTERVIKRNFFWEVLDYIGVAGFIKKVGKAGAEVVREIKAAYQSSRVLRVGATAARFLRGVSTAGVSFVVEAMAWQVVEKISDRVLASGENLVYCDVDGNEVFEGPLVYR
ncbi:MAG: hypothetical protein CMM93_07210 [Rickettsiales bacterium]|nr:hypothetical protein [Rickettsiales bacterium]|tara:strand:- start:29 stop:541 length:513 start_codon:yes stop_codon:yes gene_type:complete